nr:vegetative cell wall protein gp1-like [Aegilops tauschii subsp. strangulata]
MSSPPPNPSLPLPVTSSPTTTTVAPLLPAPGSSVAPAPAVLTSEEVSGAPRDLNQAVQEIRLFLWQPPLLAASAVLVGPLQLPSTAPPWLLWQPPLLVASAAPGALPPQPLPLPDATPQQLQRPPPVSSGPTSTAPTGVPAHQIKFPPSPSPLSQGVPIQQIKFPSSPSPLPAWIATHHVSAAVRLQAAARGLLARRRVREMRGLQLPLLPVVLRCTKDLDLVPTNSDLKVYDIGVWATISATLQGGDFGLCGRKFSKKQHG